MNYAIRCKTCDSWFEYLPTIRAIGCPQGHGEPITDLEMVATPRLWSTLLNAISYDEELT